MFETTFIALTANHSRRQDLGSTKNLELRLIPYGRHDRMMLSVRKAYYIWAPDSQLGLRTVNFFIMLRRQPHDYVFLKKECALLVIPL